MTARMIKAERQNARGTSKDNFGSIFPELLPKVGM